MKNFLTNNKIVITIFLLLAFLFIPYVISGGFIMDDWFVLRVSFFSKGIMENFLQWVNGACAFRPLSALLFAVTGELLGDNTSAQIILNLTLWISFLVITSVVLKKYFGKVFSYLFFIYAVVPAIASTTIFSPINLTVTTFTLLLWSISFYLLDYHLASKKSWAYWSSYLLLLIAMLIYEIILPLILITALFPAALKFDSQKYNVKEILKNILRYAAPVVFVVLIILVFQKLIVPLYSTSFSRLRSRSLIEMIMSFFDWFIAVFISGPVTIFSSITHYGVGIFSRPEVILLLILIITLCYFLIIKIKTDKIKLNFRDHKSFIILLAVALFASSLLIILSGYAASVSGYENRMLCTSWVLLSIFLAIISLKLFNTKLFFIPFLLIFLLYLSFMIQENNYIASWKLQNKILNDCERLIDNNAVSKGASIIANVPKYLPQNYNNEQVFSAWEFNNALEIRTNKTITGGSAFRINSQLKMDSTFIRTRNDTLYLFGYWEWFPVFVNDSLYYYKFDQLKDSSELIKVDNIQHIINLIKSDGLTDINKAPVPISRLIQEKLIYFAASAKFIPIPERVRNFLMRIYNTHQLQR